MLYYKSLSYNPLLSKPSLTKPILIYGDELVDFIKNLRNKYPCKEDDKPCPTDDTRDLYPIPLQDTMYRGLKIIHDRNYINNRSNLTFLFSTIINFHLIEIEDVTNLSTVKGKDLVLKLFINGNTDVNTDLKITIS